MTVEIGQLAYISGLPISHAFTQGLLADAPASVFLLPDELDARMAAGTLVAGPISSLEYLRNSERYTLVKDMSIGSWGRLGSSILFSKVPFARLEGAPVALPTHGATANALVRWLLDKVFGVTPAFTQVEGSLDALLETHTAALLIGDQAILDARTERDLHRLDMGEAWWQAMHTPFVHTVWVTQAELPRPERDRLAGLFRQAKELGKTHHAAIVAEASARLGLPEPEVEAYFALLNYDMTGAHMQGLGLFADQLEEPVQA